MKKTSKKTIRPARTASGRKVTINDLKAKDAGSVKGGGAGVRYNYDIAKNVKI